MNSWSPVGFVAYVVRHPRSARPLLGAAWRLRRHRWWRQAPFLPLPDRNYWHFRLATANGSMGVRPTAQAVVEAAKWSMRQTVGK